jgi:drug/metabolite transporter (DMT)-like permease
VLALTLAFGASVAWGSADFLAGVGCRRLSLLTVLLVSQAVGLALVLPVVLALGKPPPGLPFLLLGALAGVFYAAALAALYRGLARGTMGVVAPIAATDAMIPLAFGVLSGERPVPLETLGIALALAGVVLACRPAEEIDGRGGPRDSTAKSVALAVAAAVCFGCFMIALDSASEGGTLWAVASTRLTTIILLVGAAVTVRPSLSLSRSDMAPLLAIGALDVGASALFAVATTAGLLSLVGVLGSFYPVITILLAVVVLRERLDPLQRIAAIGALAGAALIASA